MTKEKREKEMLKIQLLLFGWENYLIRWLYKTSFLGTVWLARFATSTFSFFLFFFPAREQ